MLTYLRFYCPAYGAGIFQAAGELREWRSVSRFDEDELLCLLTWFSENLPVPKPFLERRSSSRFRKSWRPI